MEIREWNARKLIHAKPSEKPGVFFEDANHVVGPSVQADGFADRIGMRK